MKLLNPMTNVRYRTESYNDRIGEYGNTRRYADGSPKFHGGIDLIGDTNHVYSVAPGKVVKTWDAHKTFGICVVVMHKDEDETYYSYYAHLSYREVSQGDILGANHYIGEMGDTGNAKGTTPHLHLEIRDSQWNRLDPSKYIEINQEV